MHQSSMSLMATLLSRHLPSAEERVVLDVGSCDVNGTYRTIVPPGWRYVGTDIAAGPNVDHVMPNEDTIGFEPDGFDVIICGQVLEHCKRPWRLVPEMFRVLQPGGLAVLITVAKWPLHRYPLDCWRVYPDGMKLLLEDAGFDVLEVGAEPIEAITELYSAFPVCDCYGVGRKSTKCKS